MTITFKEKLVQIGSWIILRIPKSASAKLPSRGATMVKGLVHGRNFNAVLEPDGKGSHWLKIDNSILKGAKAGQVVTVSMEAIKEWPEPKLPADVKGALAKSSDAQGVWNDITAMARHDWLRWIRGTKQAKTSKRRVDVMISKLSAGKRRPCCFNRAECTIQEVSHKGVLLEPTEKT
jgi:hypothetical protein